MRVALDTWFSQARRVFPWRENPSPYMVLVSEVMLQQTQASRVLLYFSKWLERFPTLASLAQTSEDSVIKAWEGLGYYRRARALQKAAQVIVKEYGGVIPQEEKQLLRIPGIGPYTAGAILSFAFHKRACAIDANVERVIRRLYGVSYADPLAKKKISTFVEKLLPQENSWHTMEALIELGALLCQKKPSCLLCPVSSYCHAHLDNALEEPPKQRSTTPLYRDVACIIAHDSVLVVRREGKEVMSGLYEFPYFDSCQEGRRGDELLRYLRDHFDLHMSLGKKLPKIIHTFTRFRSHLYPWILLSQKTFPFVAGAWIKIKDLSSLPFSSGHKRICALLEEQQNTHPDDFSL